MFIAHGDSKRANFLARLFRLFGLFNKQAVIRWCGCKQASFNYLGRPTLKWLDESENHKDAATHWILRLKKRRVPTRKRFLWLK